MTLGIHSIIKNSLAQFLVVAIVEGLYYYVINLIGKTNPIAGVIN